MRTIFFQNMANSLNTDQIQQILASNSIAATPASSRSTRSTRSRSTQQISTVSLPAAPVFR